MKTTYCAANFLLTSLPFVNLLSIIEGEVHYVIQPMTFTESNVVIEEIKSITTEGLVGLIDALP